MMQSTSRMTSVAIQPAIPTPESRQVRRARERREVKIGRTVEVAPSTGHRTYEAPRATDDSPAPHPSAHPQRYPKHDDPNKGQVYGGECNITRCDRRGAVYWNMGTYGLYCPQCASGINWQPDKSPLCVLVDAKPELAEMEQFKLDHDYYGVR